MAQHKMTPDSIDLERIPLQGLRRLEEGTHGTTVAFLGESAPTVSTSGRDVPSINWGEKRMSPGDLEVIHSAISNFTSVRLSVRLLAAEPLTPEWLQGLKKQVESQGPWEMASGLLTRMFQQNLLDDFYRRQNDIIDSLMEVSCMHRYMRMHHLLRAFSGRSKLMRHTSFPCMLHLWEILGGLVEKCRSVCVCV